jgi:hypothetical protein
MSKQGTRKSFIQYELPAETLEKVQGGGGKMTTMAVGEECGTFTTLAVGEEGGSPLY